MLDSVYIGMSGLTSFSKGLANISNNVANLNTPGFKGTGLNFLDLFYKYQFTNAGGSGGESYFQGSGVSTGSTSTRFKQGEFRQTGNDLDVAIDGQGFFVLKKEGRVLYSRDGQFLLDSQGYLVGRSDAARVQILDGSTLRDFNISGLRSNRPVPTTLIKLRDSLSTNSNNFEVTNINVIDSLGKQHTLKLELVNDTANISGRWTYKILEGSSELANGEVRYQGSGVPQAGFEKPSFIFNPGGGAQSTSIILDFSNSTLFSSSASTLKLDSQNGIAAGFLTKTTIDQEGTIVLNYSNGQIVKNRQLAVATFNNLSVLTAQGASRYIASNDAQPNISKVNKNSVGVIRPGSFELSNVDLAGEFGDLIVVQRAYQASSQVITAANEMIQQLAEIRGRR